VSEQSSELGQLAAAVAAVMASYRGVEKSGVNSFHRYKYASDADLLWTLKPAMAANGLAFVLVNWEIVRESEAKTKGGGAERLVDLAVTYRLIHKSGEYLTIKAPGSGQDPGDKALYKAMTGAFKYALRQTFAVPTGDDPERDEVARVETLRPVASGGAFDVAPILTAFQGINPSWTGDQLAELVGVATVDDLTAAHRDKLKACFKQAQAGTLNPRSTS